MLRLLAPALLASAAFAATAEQWQNKTIYQVRSPAHIVLPSSLNPSKLVVDRFATVDGSSPKCDTGDRVHCGGSWQGVINKLDYIQDLGFDAIWISPVVANIEGNTTYGEAYHG